MEVFIGFGGFSSENYPKKRRKGGRNVRESKLDNDRVQRARAIDLPLRKRLIECRVATHCSDCFESPKDSPFEFGRKRSIAAWPTSHQSSAQALFDASLCRSERLDRTNETLTNTSSAQSCDGQSTHPPKFAVARFGHLLRSTFDV
jgi:hypothetical protein